MPFISKAFSRRCLHSNIYVSRTTPFFSLLGCKVIVETFIGSVEGTLKHIDYMLSHNHVEKYPSWLILENENGFMLIRDWQVVKKKSQESMEGIRRRNEMHLIK